MPGPRRVAEWISQNRDPRSKSVDAVDWVESIPISETRNYVQRVLENVQVYRQPHRRHADRAFDRAGSEAVAAAE